MKKPDLRVYPRVHFALASAIAAILVTQAAYAGTYYWDTTDPIQDAGFGNAGGTWGSDESWSDSKAGTSAFGILSPTTSDDLNFGYLTTGLGTGTVALTGTQSAKSLTFAFGSGAIALSGGTAINLPAASTITVNNATNTISTPLTGAATSLTKLGTGALTLNGANTYTGTTLIGNGALQIGDGTTGSLVGTNPLTFSGTGTFNVQKAASSTQGMGTLSFNAGQGKVQNTFNATSSTLTFSGLNARSAGATANFTTSGGTNGTTNKIVLSSTTNAPMSNSGSNNRGIFFGLDSLSSAVSFARYDATGGFFRATNYGVDTNATTTAGPYGSAVDLSLGDVTTSLGASVSLNTLRAVTTTGGRRFDVGTNTLSINGVLAVISTGRFTIGTGTADQGFLQPTTDGGEVVIAATRLNTSPNTTNLLISNVIQDFSGGSAGTKVTAESNATMVFGSSNTYTGVTTINSGLLRVTKWADAGSASGLGMGSTGTTPNAADIVINGGALNYGNVAAGNPARTNRLFTIGPAGATLDNSSNATTTTNTWAIGQNSDGSSSGSIAFSDPNAPASLTLAHNAPAADQYGTGTLGAVLGDPGTGANVTSLTKNGAGTWILSAANTYTGNTTVNAGTLTLGSTGTLKFVPTANGVCNKITGAGRATLNGTFNIDLTNAAIANGNKWKLVDVQTLTETYGGTFAVTGFTGSSGVWTKADGPNIWTYTESTGELGLQTNGGSYTLAYTAGANGSITGTSSQTVAFGGNGTAVTAVPDAEHHFVDWSDGSTDNPRTDSNVTANVSVTANFAMDTYWLNYTAGANGSITGNSAQTVPSSNDGTEVTAVPDTGYHFVDWSDGRTDNPRAEISVFHDVNVTANFAINTYTLAYTAGANGSITGTTPQTVNHNTNGTAVTAVPASGYRFVDWSDGSTTNPRTDSSVTANLSVTANFAINTYTLTYEASEDGFLTGTLSQTVASGGNGTAVTAVPATGFAFVEWNDGSTDNPRTDSNVTADAVLVAYFARDSYTLTYLAGANGSITGTTSQTVNPNTNGTAVTAVPATGYRFVNWSDGSTTNPRTDSNVTADVSVTANFVIDTYTLTYEASEDGFLTGTLSQTVASGGNGTAVTAVPATGFAFVEWSDGSTDNPRTDSNVTANVSVTANFARGLYTLTYTAGANGSITGTTPQTVDYNTSGTAVTAVPATGYRFVNWSDGSTTNPRTDSNVTADVDITANFVITTYTLTYTAGANGSITGSTPQTVNYNTSGSAVRAVPATGYRFVDWSDGSTTNPRRDFSVTADVSVTANFAIRNYTLTYTAGANGSITGDTPQTVDYNTSGTAVTAVPATGYRFVRWSDDSTTNPRTDSSVTAHVSVTANFARINHTLTYTAGANGSISGTTPQTVGYSLDGSAVTAVPATGYRFVDWSDGSTTNPRNDSNVTANVSVTANFAIKTYTLYYEAGDNGSITGTTPQTVNHGSNGTAVTAVPATDYIFVEWSDGSTDNPRTDSNVTANVSFTANFVRDFYTLTYTAGANGSITGDTSQTVNHNASGTAVTAVPATGYRFVEWNDGSTDNPRTDTNVSEDVNITASFALNTYTLTYTAGANGSITGTTPQTVNHGTNGTAVTAVPATDYIFVDWSDGSTDNPRTDSNVTADVDITANFVIATYTLTYTAGANGSITGDTAQTVDYNTNGTEVTAVPATGYIFVDWSDGLNANPRIDSSVTENVSVTANFVANTSGADGPTIDGTLFYTLAYTAGANGSITGTTPQRVSQNTNGTAVTAVPSTGYHFVNWSDGSTTNPRTDSSVTANVSVTANFAIDRYSDWATANGVTGGVNGDSNNDGVPNGIAYFMGVTGQSTNPSLNASRQVTWPVNPDYQGTFKVQTSSDLSTWTDVTPQPTPAAGNLTHTLPSGLGKQFVRLAVTPD